MQKLQIPKNLVFAGLGIFLSTQILSFIFSIDKYVSFYGYYTRLNGGLLSLIFFFLLFIALSSVWEKKFILKTLKISVFTSLAVSTIGILSKFNIDLVCFTLVQNIQNTCWTNQFRPSERIFSTLGQPNWLAAYLVVNTIFALFFFFRSKKINLVYLAVFTINITAVVFTRSTSGILSLFASLSIFSFLLLSKKQASLKKIAAFLSLSALVVMIFIDKSYFISRLKNLFPKSQKTSPALQENIDIVADPEERITDSGKIRLIVWKGAIELWKKHPLLGTGPETFGISYFFTRPKEHNLTSEWNFIYNKAHNEFLNYLANTGIIGFLGFMSFLGAVFWTNIKKLKKSSDIVYIAVFSALTGIQVSNFFGFSTSTISLFTFTLPIILLNYEKDKKTIRSPKKKINYFLSTTVAIFVASVFFFLYLFYRADLYYADGKSAMQSTEPIEATEKLNNAVSTLYHPEYADALALSLADFYSLSNQISKEEKDSTLKDLSIYFNQKSIKDSPYNIKYLKTSGKISLIFYQIDKDPKILDWGISKLKKARSIAPTDVASFYSLLFLKFIRYQDNEQKLQEILQQQIPNLIDLKPDYTPSHTLKSKIIFLTQGKKQAIEYLENVNKKLKDPNIENEIKLLKDI